MAEARAIITELKNKVEKVKINISFQYSNSKPRSGYIFQQ